uniref:Uncharacterized protein n=1 Tax=Lutzomyia longipalpis TaxID=7200 RepID=A0A1B0CJG3_LUTLO
MPELMHDPILPSGDPIELYPIAEGVMQLPPMVFIAAPMLDMPDEPSTADPKLPLCGDTDVIPPTVIPIVFMEYVGAPMGLILPPAILDELVVSG